MRGTCEIVLKDRNNKIVRREKEHNLVTNFFDEYYKELGPVKGLPYNYAIEDMVGGILLFQNTIEADADNVLLPSGNKMIGNGATLIAQGSGAAVKELGTWIEDGTMWIDHDTYQMKYEWAPSQAVGTIRSVCLTSRAHGFIGEGNETSEAQRSTPSSSQTNYEHFYQSWLNKGYDQGHKCGGKVHCVYDNVAYRVIDNASNGQILVHKNYIPMSEIQFRDGASQHDPLLLETITHSIDAEYMEDIRAMGDYAKIIVSTSEDGKIHFILAQANSSSSISYNFYVTTTHPYVYCYTYDIEDDSFTCKRINLYSYYMKRTGFKPFYDGKYLVIIPDNYYSSNYSDQHVSAIDTDELTLNDLGQVCRSGYYTTLYRCDNHQFYFYISNRYQVGDMYQGVKIDAARGSWGFINLTGGGTYLSSVFKPKGTKLTGLEYNNPYTIFNRHGDYLATIFNLPQAVTKTADLTMQITYTLTF